MRQEELPPGHPNCPLARDLPPDQLELLYETHGLRPSYSVTVTWKPDLPNGSHGWSSATPWRGVVLEPLDFLGRIWLVARKHYEGKGFVGVEHVPVEAIERPSLLERIAYAVRDAEAKQPPGQ